MGAEATQCGLPLICASHWVQQGSADADLRLVVRSLAYQLAVSDPEYRVALHTATDPWALSVPSPGGSMDKSASYLCGGAIPLDQLVSVLLVHPLSRLTQPPLAMLFIDAVDECTHNAGITGEQQLS